MDAKIAKCPLDIGDYREDIVDGFSVNINKASLPKEVVVILVYLALTIHTDDYLEESKIPLRPLFCIPAILRILGWEGIEVIKILTALRKLYTI